MYEALPEEGKAVTNKAMSLSAGWAKCGRPAFDVAPDGYLDDLRASSERDIKAACERIIEERAS